jgi:hypothetical protein
MQTLTTEKLAPHEVQILKEIIIVGQRNETETRLGSIYYTRPLTEEYNMEKQRAWDEKHPNKIERIMGEYPRQENYPEDPVDVLIKGAILSRFSNSYIKNELLLFQLHKDKLELALKNPSIQAELLITPEISFYDDLEKYLGRSLRYFKEPLKMFTYYASDNALQDTVFFNSYDISDITLINNLEDITFL